MHNEFDSGPHAVGRDDGLAEIHGANNSRREWIETRRCNEDIAQGHEPVEILRLHPRHKSYSLFQPSFLGQPRKCFRFGARADQYRAPLRVNLFMQDVQGFDECIEALGQDQPTRCEYHQRVLRYSMVVFQRAHVAGVGTLAPIRRTKNGSVTSLSARTPSAFNPSAASFPVTNTVPRVRLIMLTINFFMSDFDLALAEPLPGRGVSF